MTFALTAALPGSPGHGEERDAMASAFVLANKKGLLVPGSSSRARLALPCGFVGSPPGQIAPSWRAGSAGAAE